MTERSGMIYDICALCVRVFVLCVICVYGPEGNVMWIERSGPEGNVMWTERSGPEGVCA